MLVSANPEELNRSMNAQNYTQKSLQAIQAAQQLTIQNQNQQIEQVHLLSALLQQDGGLVPQLLKKMGISVESLDAAVTAEVNKLCLAPSR